MRLPLHKFCNFRSIYLIFRTLGALTCTRSLTGNYWQSSFVISHCRVLHDHGRLHRYKGTSYPRIFRNEPQCALLVERVHSGLHLNCQLGDQSASPPESSLMLLHSYHRRYPQIGDNVTPSPSHHGVFSAEG